MEEETLKTESQEFEIPVIENSVPTKWARIIEIETWVGGNTYNNNGGRAKLIVNHYCGDNKEDLIGQLETLIYGLKNGFDSFAT